MDAKLEGHGGLRIGQVAARAGVTAKAIRHYEAIGLLRAPRRSPKGYRLYDSAIVEELRFIGRGKALGLALDEIRALIETARAGPSGVLRGQVVAVLDQKLAQHERRIAELVARRNALTAHRRLAVVATSAPSCDCHGFAVECPCLPVEVAGAFHADRA